MAQHDYDIANQAGSLFRTDLNNVLASIVSNNSGASAPTVPYAFQWWADTTTGLLKLRNSANTAWITVGSLASGIFSTGTRMLFAQTAAPSGWTKDTSNFNNHAIRVVTGTASTGGTVDFTTAFVSQSVAGTVGNTALTIAQLAAHTHSYQRRNASSALSGGTSANAGEAGATTGSTGSGSTHTHSFSGTAINLAVKYLDVITATKD